MFFGFDGDKFGLAFDVAIHIGTLLAVVAYFRHDLRALVLSVPHLFQPGRPSAGQHVPIDRQDVRAGAEGARLIWLLAVGTIPAVVLGFFVRTASRSGCGRRPSPPPRSSRARSPSWRPSGSARSGATRKA